MYELETRRKSNELKLIAAANDFKQISITKSDLIKEISKLVFQAYVAMTFRWKVKRR